MALFVFHFPATYIVNAALLFIPLHTTLLKSLSPAVRKRIYSSLSPTSEAKLNVMHAAFLAVQYDSNDNGLLMKCKSMINGLCKEHFMMPGLEVGCSLYHLLQIVEVANHFFFY